MPVQFEGHARCLDLGSSWFVTQSQNCIDCPFRLSFVSYSFSSTFTVRISSVAASLPRSRKRVPTFSGLVSLSVMLPRSSEICKTTARQRVLFHTLSSLLQLLQHLHSENKLGCRFPIGLEEQITKWDSATIQAFHKRWYFPGNATLFIVGDFGPVDNVLNLINQQFSKVPPAVYYPNRNPATSPAAASLHSPNPEGQNPKPSLFPGFSPSRSPSHTTSNSPNPETLKPSHAALQSLSSLFNSVQNPLNPGKHQPNPLSKKEVAPFPPLPEPIRKERHAIRPPVEHQWSSESMLQYAKSGYPAKRGQPVVPQVFQHELLQHFSMNIFSKVGSLN